MTGPASVAPGSRGEPAPGLLYRAFRRLVQTAALFAVVLAPLLGGWQREGRADMALFDGRGFDLAEGLRRALPGGETARRVHDLNLLKGGGIAHDYFGIAAMDPLAGTLALLGGSFDGRAWLAWSLPIALGLLAGRAFCGFVCPFGTLSRWLDAALSLSPFHSRIALPRSRPLRFVVAIACVVLALFGVHLALYLTLPYLLLQQSVYAAWLLGGGGAAVGLLLGLLVAGLAFGPTTYCATLCPTGGVLALLGRVRRVHLTLAAPRLCGRSCTLCSRACWIQLDPSSGDPGPDCDLCARCVPACPRANLVLTTRSPRRRLPVVAPVLLVVAAWPGSADADAPGKPRLALDAELQRGRVTLAVTVVDGADAVSPGDAAGPGGSELSVFLARGARSLPDEDGLVARRQVYRGPLTVDLERADGVTRVQFPSVTSPRSTQRQAIYRTQLAASLSAGDVVRVAPVPGWLESGARFVVPPAGTALGVGRGLAFFAAGLALYSGLLSLSLSRRSRAGA